MIKLRELEAKNKINFIVDDIDREVLEKIDLLIQAYEETQYDVKFNDLSAEFDYEDIQNLYESKSNFIDQDIQFSFEEAEDSHIELWGYKFILKRKYYIDKIRLSKEETESKLKISKGIIKLKFILAKDSTSKGYSTIHSVLHI